MEASFSKAAAAAAVANQTNFIEGAQWSCGLKEADFIIFIPSDVKCVFASSWRDERKSVA